MLGPLDLGNGNHYDLGKATRRRPDNSLLHFPACEVHFAVTLMQSVRAKKAVQTRLGTPQYVHIRDSYKTNKQPCPTPLN
jgi:hypothetical protein